MTFSSRLAIAAAVLATFGTVHASPAIDFQNFQTPRLDSIKGGLQVSSFQSFAPQSLFAYPLQAPPVNGFQPLVAVTLTDRRDPAGDINFYAHAANSRVGNVLPRSGGAEYTYLATLDSGGQSHILSAADAIAVDIAGAGRGGTFEAGVTGAGGGEAEYLLISDPLGVFVTGAQNLTNAPGAALQAPASSYRGQTHTSVMTAYEGSILPSIIGVPMMAQHDINIRNSQTKRIVRPSGTAVRTPSIELVNHGQAQQYQYRLSITMQDALGAATAQPAFFPGFGDLQDFSNDPGAPTFWSFPIANANLGHTAGSLNQQAFLFDTGAQVTVLSEETADALGFDAETDTPDFTVNVLGVGGITIAKGFFLQTLSLNVTGGDAVWHDVPVIVLNITDPRTGSGTLPGILGMNLFTDRDMSLDLNAGGQSNVRFSAPITPQWNVNGSGVWLPDANWDLGVPDGFDVPANFLGAITSASTVTVDQNYTIGSMTFDNANSYTIAGPGRLTLETVGRPSKIEVLSGSHTISAPMTLGTTDSPRTSIVVANGSTLTLAGDTASPLAEVSKQGAGQLKLQNARFKSLSVQAGSVQLTASAPGVDDSRVESLSISAGAVLDIGAQEVVIDYATTSPIADVRGHLAAGRLISSAATATTAIGYAEASVLGISSFDTIAIDGDAIVMRLLTRGDANFDEHVNFDDLLILAQNYGRQTGQVWTSGDFTYDGATNFDDLLILAQHYGSGPQLGEAEGFSADFAADWALARSLVPEPTSLIAMSGVLLFGARRRR